MRVLCTVLSFLSSDCIAKVPGGRKENNNSVLLPCMCNMPTIFFWLFTSFNSTTFWVWLMRCTISSLIGVDSTIIFYLFCGQQCVNFVTLCPHYLDEPTFLEWIGMYVDRFVLNTTISCFAVATSQSSPSRGILASKLCITMQFHPILQRSCAWLTLASEFTRWIPFVLMPIFTGSWDLRGGLPLI